MDHCHKNLSFRGYICRSCNSGIGLLHDDPDTLKRAFIYLTNETKPTTILLDADYFFYRAAAASEYEMTWDADVTVIAGSLTNGQKIIRSDVKQLKERFDTDELIMTFTDVENFRKN